MELQSKVEVGDTVQMDYNGPGYDPVFEVVDVYDDGVMRKPVVELSNGATIFQSQIGESGPFEVVDE